MDADRPVLLHIAQDLDPAFFKRVTDPDPHLSEKLDPAPYLSEKRDPYPH
jgi:hypothetical protein